MNQSSKQSVNLKNIRIASPCNQSWAKMTGDEKSRFCQLCELNVYNLSGMTKQEAESFLSQKEGRVCVRYFQREDGTILTKDCPVGIELKHKRRTRIIRQSIKGGIAASVLIATAIGTFTHQVNANNKNEPLMGAVPIHQEVAGGMFIPPKVDNKEIMGDIAEPSPPEKQVEPAVNNPPRQLMGKPMIKPEQPPEIMGEMIAPDVQ